jgi:hypothetical protein
MGRVFKIESENIKRNYEKDQLYDDKWEVKIFIEGKKWNRGGEKRKFWKKITNSHKQPIS